MLPIAAIVPFIPLIDKAIDIYADKKRGKKKTVDAVIEAAKSATFITEGAQVVYAVSLWGIVQAVASCGELSLASLDCITAEQWTYLGSSIAIVWGRLKSKWAKDK